MEIDPNQCFNELQKIFSEKDLTVDELLREKLPLLAKKYATEKIGSRQNISCGVNYDPEKSPEILIWALGLVCECWTLELFKRKTFDGHCHTHKQKNRKSCEKGTEFHRELYDEAKNSFEQVIEHAEKQMSNIDR